MRKFGLLIDWRLFLPAVILVILGLTTLTTLSSSLFKSQLITFAASVVAYLIFSQVTLDSFRGFYFPLYLLSLFLLIVVFLFGFESHGAARWIVILGVSLQFSELLKPFLLVSLSAYLSSVSNSSFRSFASILLFLLPALFLIYKQPDLGNAIIYAFTAISTMVLFGFPFLWFGVTLCALLAISPLFWGILHDYQRQRILTFLHPTSDPLGTSYNAIQAVIAVGSGMFFGKGLGQATQSGLRFLPERHTDFMFATFTESFGFFGGMLVFICFGLLCYRIYTIFSRTDDAFSKIFSAGALILLLMHFFFNVGMNIGVVPVVGVTLPFLSYGGNSLLSFFILLGMLTSISHSLKGKRVLEIR
ncbi:MAG: rod shape-determining protein RodA [Candidatus Levybacteria bacterium]|nr:rod shape-determining protein RodA [Candidatus Levybacteria bacterium]